jgi:serine/threonine-protein kinase
MDAVTFGRYEVLAEIGRGAMGVVYKARDPELERVVAVKAVNMALEGEGSAFYEKRFYQEARTAAALNHPNIVTIHDIGRSGEMLYLAMEYIEGVELRALLATGHLLGLPRALSYGEQIADGLAYAHGRGVVHRDIKPANLMVVRDGTLKITDFGVARMRAADVQTQSGQMPGSPQYMAPEQALGQRADFRSDQFSLGVVLYELLTGRPPFAGENITTLVFQIVNYAPPPPSAVSPAVPDFVEAIVTRLLAKKPEERYGSTADAARDLRAARRRVSGQAAAPAGPA